MHTNSLFNHSLFLFILFHVFFLTPSTARESLVVEFVLTNAFASGVIRGDMISSFLNDLPNATSRAVQQDIFLHADRDRPRDFQTVDFCICVKCDSVSDEDLSEMIERCHDLGGSFGWDVIDYFPAIGEIHYHVDFWLVTNSLVQGYLAKVMIPRDRVFLWPHPHTNFCSNCSVFADGNDFNQTTLEIENQLTVGFTANPRNMYVLSYYYYFIFYFYYLFLIFLLIFLFLFFYLLFLIEIMHSLMISKRN